MRRIAIVGGGMAGVAAAYELALLQQRGADIEFVLLEATGRLGGIVETVRRDGFVIECGPDSWVTEKPWARELARELGMEDEIIFSQDACRKTYLAQHDGLVPMPGGMRMMVPYQWDGVLNSSLFSEEVKRAYLCEPELADQLKANALDATHGSPRDESVRDFILRHFGGEIADTIAAPLLAGVFGGDINMLSARAVLPTFVALEREHGSLILGLQERMKEKSVQSRIFTTLKNGVAGLIESMESCIPASNVRLHARVNKLEAMDKSWRVHGILRGPDAMELFDAVLLATPARMTARLLAPLNGELAHLLPEQASSAIVVAFAFSPEQAEQLRIPSGFGFLVPQSSAAASGQGDNVDAVAERALLACTFVDQKFPHRVPQGGMLLRAFFGGPAAPHLIDLPDAALTALARTALERILGNLPEASFAIVRRWPDSLPLYTVGHLDRIAELERRVAELPRMRLIGNAYCGVGLPDLVRSGRTAAQQVVNSFVRSG